jgi:hypothetical protein
MGKRFDCQLRSTTAENNNHARCEERVAHEIMVVEEQLMKQIRLISMGALALFLGVFAPTYAQQDQGAKPEQHAQQTKPKKQQAAKPSKQEQQQTKGEQEQQQKQQQQRTKTANQNEQRQVKGQQEQQQKQQQRQAQTQQNQENSQQHQQQASGQQREQPQGQWAHNGQRDSRGHEYNQGRFGPEHHARFEENGGRNYSGRREYSYGGFWFYAEAYPAWFYQQDVYFIMGADGLWYAVAYGDPSLMFQVDIE